MNLTFETFCPENQDHIIAAHYLGDWSRTSNSMLSLDLERMQAFALGIMAFKEKESTKPLGHIAVTTYDNGNAMFGGYIVDPSMRGNGIGVALLSRLVVAAREAFSDMETCTAYVNSHAVSQFTKVGGQVLGLRDYEAATGCNTVIDMMPAIKKVELVS